MLAYSLIGDFVRLNIFLNMNMLLSLLRSSAAGSLDAADGLAIDALLSNAVLAHQLAHNGDKHSLVFQLDFESLPAALPAASPSISDPSLEVPAFLAAASAATIAFPAVSARHSRTFHHTSPPNMHTAPIL